MVIKWPLCRRSRRDVVERAIFHSVRSSSSPLFNWMDLFLFFFSIRHLDESTIQLPNLLFYFFLCRVLVNSRHFFFDGKMKEIVLTVFVLFRLSFHTGRRNIMRRGGEKKQVEIQKFFFSECSLIRFGRSRERNQKGNRKQSRDEQLVSF
jgi:hypothetical protein